MKIEPVPLLLVIPFYWLCLCNHIFVVSSLCLNDQWSLLLQFKNNLTFYSESNNKLKSWNSSHDCCTWMGVTCDKEGHVTDLDLSGESISGGFDNSSSLFSLQHLQKLNLAANDFMSIIPSGFNKLEKLTYLNLSNAGFVGQVPTEISQLTRLVALDLSSDSFLSLENLELENLTSIRQLYLDGVSMKQQEWYKALLPLRDLQELSMWGCNLSGPLDSSLATLENLSVIILEFNNFSSPVPETFANFKNLTTLVLASCGLNGRFPAKIFQIGTLSVIDISDNKNLHGFFPNFPLSGSLRTVRVSYTNFSGALPHSIGNMRHLFELDLHNCQFNGTLPNSLSNLTQLSYLLLSNNSFTGPMPSFSMVKKLTHLVISYNGLSGAIPSSHFEGLHNLVTIDLRYNSFSGSIPSSLFTLPLLQMILISNNQFNQLDEFINVSSSIMLDTLDLSCNNLSGPFPTSIFQINTLSVLIISDNKFNGPMLLNKLSELKNLTVLDISYNNFSVNVNVTNVDPSSFSNIYSLNMASCNLKTFPSFLRNQSRLNYLDLSDNQIQGKVPNWIWKLQNLQNLNVSHNLLTDLEVPFQNLTSSLRVLDLHNNQLHGPMPVFPIYAYYLDYSRNKFSSIIPQDIGNYLSNTFFLSLSNNNLLGNIPYSLCYASSLQVLDLSNNNISGTIPSCLMTITKILGLRVLNLRKNNLKGPIPDMFPTSCSLKTLDLHNNLLHGPIPKSIAYCSTLEVLDLGTNQIIGGFPCFLKKISTIRVLVLRNNKFQGSLGCSAVDKSWNVLQIMDIAFNNFSGKLPGKYFATLETMMLDQDQTVIEFIKMGSSSFGVYYQDSVTVINKGQQMELVKILKVFTTIDFSSNHFEGPMPEELMEFKALHVLNFSNNALSGEIPLSIGDLKQLESLDLSQNSLGGEIPVQLASLSFLSYLNLSFNHLVGRIPTGTQLQSFPASSFEGNEGLYGPPLADKSDGKHQGLLPQQGCGRLACTIDWNFISVELGFVFGLGIVIGPLLFWKQWKVRHWRLVDKILCWIFPRLYLEHVTHRGQRYTVLRWWH